jgi:hypothetical protein
MYGEHACRKKITPITHNETNNVASRKNLANVIFHAENRLVLQLHLCILALIHCPKLWGKPITKNLHPG